MILADTSIWIEHFRGGAPAADFRTLLTDGEILIHPFIVGELALGVPTR